MPVYRTPAALREQLAEHIEFELAGQVLRVERIPVDFFTRVHAGFEAGGANGTLVLELLVGTEAVEALGPIDGREYFHLMNWLMPLLTPTSEASAGGNSGAPSQE